MRNFETATNTFLFAGLVTAPLASVFCVLAWTTVSVPVLIGTIMLVLTSLTVVLIAGLTTLQQRESPWFQYLLTSLSRFFQASLLMALGVLLVPLPLWYVGLVAASLLVSGLVVLCFSVSRSRANVSTSLTAASNSPYLIWGVLLVLVTLYGWNLTGYGFQMDELYGAREVKTFFNEGKLFYLEDTYYGRSEVTTLIGIAAETIARNLPIAIPIEVSLRLPMLILSVAGVWLLYCLLRRTTSEFVAVGAAALVGLETYLVYFATYYRFYAITNFFIIVTLYLLIRYRSRYVALVGSVVWAIGYLVLTEYCLFVSGFLLLWYLAKLWVERWTVSRAEWLLAVSGFVLFPTIVATMLASRQTADAVYSLLALEFNLEAVMLMSHWLFVNYAPFLVVAFLGAIGLGLLWWRQGYRALPSWTVLMVFLWANVLFLFCYVVHASFNFTFRVTIFFLPVLLALFLVVLREVMKFSPRYILLVAVISSGYAAAASWWYITDEPGDRFFPTKPLYEKQPLVVANDAVADFFNTTIQPQNPAVIGYLGLGIDDVRYYSDHHVAQRLLGDFRFRRVGNSSLEDLEQFLSDNRYRDVYMVVAANAQPTLKNDLQALIFSRPTALEVNYNLVTAITENPDFRLVFRAPDGHTVVYLRSGLLSESDIPNR